MGSRFSGSEKKNKFLQSHSIFSKSNVIVEMVSRVHVDRAIKSVSSVIRYIEIRYPVTGPVEKDMAPFL